MTETIDKRVNIPEGMRVDVKEERTWDSVYVFAEHFYDGKKIIPFVTRARRHEVRHNGFNSTRTVFLLEDAEGGLCDGDPDLAALTYGSFALIDNDIERNLIEAFTKRLVKYIKDNQQVPNKTL